MFFFNFILLDLVHFSCLQSSLEYQGTGSSPSLMSSTSVINIPSTYSPIFFSKMGPKRISIKHRLLVSAKVGCVQISKIWCHYVLSDIREHQSNQKEEEKNILNWGSEEREHKQDGKGKRLGNIEGIVFEWVLMHRKYYNRQSCTNTTDSSGMRSAFTKFCRNKSHNIFIHLKFTYCSVCQVLYREENTMIIENRHSAYPWNL